MKKKECREEGNCYFYTFSLMNCVYPAPGGKVRRQLFRYLEHEKRRRYCSLEICLSLQIQIFLVIIKFCFPHFNYKVHSHGWVHASVYVVVCFSSVPHMTNGIHAFHQNNCSYRDICMYCIFHFLINIDHEICAVL